MLPTFANSSLLTTALTHKSALNEPRWQHAQSYERLEFLGDAVLELAVSHYLYARFPDANEGVLTNYRSALVKTESLAAVAITLQLGDRIHMSKGESRSGGRANKSILADVLEAIIGALYIDQGFAAVESFLHQHLFPQLDTILQAHAYKDAKSTLQETVQAQGLSAPTYKVLQATGPDHSKQFTIQVLINGQVAGQGEGPSKQIAQQQAAQLALEAFGKGMYNAQST